MKQATPQKLPRHIAVIMDGNGRWAGNRHLPRAAGHKAGVKTLRRVVEHCIGRGIEILTVYAFSSENWQRPREEVSFLLELFIASLKEQVDDLHQNGVMLRFIGDRSAFPDKLQTAINGAETLTAGNHGLQLVVAVNYGGRWDITTACRRLAARAAAGEIDLDAIDEQHLSRLLSLGDLPDPELFIRTGGEIRISNYLLWQLAYTEMYFTRVLWPDFDGPHLDEAIEWYQARQRRFGRTSSQVEQAKTA